MTNLRRILVIEDNEKHRRDVEALLEERIAQGVPLTIDYVATLDDAMSKLSGSQYDGILSDVLFPKAKGGEEEQHGTDIATYAMQHQIPWVLVTSTFHHGAKTEPANQFARSCGSEIVDCHPDFKKGDDYNTFNSPNKNWKAGYVALMYFIELHKKGLVKTKASDPTFYRSSDFTSKLALDVEYVNEDRTEYRPGIDSVINFLNGCYDLTNPSLVSKKEDALHALGTSTYEILFGQNAFLAKVLDNEYCRGLYNIPQ